MMCMEAVGVQYLLVRNEKGQLVPVTAAQGVIVTAARLTKDLCLSGGIMVGWA